jgi:DNA-binding NarL/FixJ family response regulator
MSCPRSWPPPRNWRSGRSRSTRWTRRVHVDERRVRFRHPLVRSGVRQAEPVTRRQAANAALAAVLDNEPYRRIHHRAQSIVGPDDAVADELADSHTISLRRGSVTAANWALERAAELTTDPAKRGRRLLLAAEQAFGLGHADLVDRLLAATTRTTLSYLDRARMPWLREIFNDGVPGDAVRVLELCDVAAKSSWAGDPDLALNLLLGAGMRCWWADTGPAARAWVADATRRLEGVEADPRYVAALAVAEPVSEGAAVTGVLAGIAVEQVADADALRLLGMAAHAIGDPVRAVGFLDRAETKLRGQGRLGLLTHMLTMQVPDRLELGDWERAAAAVDEGHRLAHDTGQPIWDTGSLVFTAIIAVLRGDNERAQELATRSEHAANGRNLTDLLACVQLARGVGWLGSGRHSEAYQALRRLFDPDSPSFHLTERFHGVMFLAEAAVHADRRDDARSVVAELVEVAAVTPSPTLHVHLAYARGPRRGPAVADRHRPGRVPDHPGRTDQRPQTRARARRRAPAGLPAGHTGHHHPQPRTRRSIHRRPESRRHRTRPHRHTRTRPGRGRHPARRARTRRHLPPPRATSTPRPAGDHAVLGQRRKTHMTIRVLIADDQPVIRAGFRMLIDAEPDLEVVGEAGTGREAVTLARDTHADVVLMDIRMPDMDGLDATRTISADDTLADVKVLILTTFEADEYVFEALRGGASGFLGKGGQPAAVLDGIRTVARGEELLSPKATRALIAHYLTRPQPVPRLEPSGMDRLTEREREVLGLVATGLSNDNIATRLFLSPHTVKTHVNRMMAKLGVRDRAQLVVIAYQTGFTPYPG